MKKSPQFFCYQPRPKGFVPQAELEPLERVVLQQLTDFVGFIRTRGAMPGTIAAVMGLDATHVLAALRSLESRGLVEQPTPDRWRKKR